MTRPPEVSRDEWLRARKRLLAEEKELTRKQDALAAARRALPMVRIDKEYGFEGEAGKASLAELFEGRRQLIVYHMMWRWDLDAGCPSCAMLLDNVGHLAHLHAQNTTFAAVSRGPWESLGPYRERMGWAFPMYSSFGGDFNYDFHATLDESVAPVEYNYLSKAELKLKGQTWHAEGEQPGTSVFWRDDDDTVFHTYSAYSRGGDILIGTHNLLDLTPLGRQRHVGEAVHHDRYGIDRPPCH
ncbi:DUF899 domain-containing protein [Nocardia bhagyanarayanae]|uniref:Putative dithiol-disulfide oxidoreductase (DUF899 family) n=1 Tax=Nocardia bhagyanarayanae TaxID=1215925 RepID=A0A543EVV6_9NOCA|nr:DUF899 domain-containing protein [Nocardia bhagyanarayanae]TQM25716.1 putative dithiol-disulfide oxidoreductase (DUF899 family) [Nocardia bhagyanarayanae]